ncbi:hypothetical protein KNO15_16395 [Leifsonia shinshuensis]|uniref:hypothetical protein n=1 Tax=Leifsonia shinshuensis TaxID=150026 RepID=UPI001F512AF5|nr:hypothetical protein [Leifsonia shinshuensis]MCI0158283.1 hypothetical protein [Leifsonia shinshuensis]
MSPESTLERELRRAWHASSGNDFASRLARSSLEASASQVPELEQALFELKNGFQAELDVHLSGEGVIDHETDAYSFAEFVRGIADAVKEVSKQAMGRQRLRSPLHIVAPAPGSVHLVLRVPPPREEDGSIVEARTESQHSLSLGIVAAVLARAGTSGNEESFSLLGGMTNQLPTKAHAGLRRAAKAISRTNWDVEGELKRPQSDALRLELGRPGALALLDALDAKTNEEDVATLRGRVDGQRRSVGAMWFLPDNAGPIEAAIVDPDLIDPIAHFSAEETPTVATFKVVRWIPAGTNARTRQTYVLTEIRQDDPPARLDGIE